MTCRFAVGPIVARLCHGILAPFASNPHCGLQDALADFPGHALLQRFSGVAKSRSGVARTPARLLRLPTSRCSRSPRCSRVQTGSSSSTPGALARTSAITQSKSDRELGSTTTSSLGNACATNRSMSTKGGSSGSSAITITEASSSSTWTMPRTGRPDPPARFHVMRRRGSRARSWIGVKTNDSASSRIAADSPEESSTRPRPSDCSSARTPEFLARARAEALRTASTAIALRASILPSGVRAAYDRTPP